jgi:hypothetical protein
MSRRSKGPRLYLRTGRIDRRTGRELPAIWYIRDGQVEVSTGCGPDGLHGPQGAESQLSRYIAAKWAPRTEGGADDSPQRLSDPDRVLVAEVLALYAAEKAPKLADPGSRAASVTTLLGWWGEKTVYDIKRSSCEAYVAHRCTQAIRAFKADTAEKRLVTPQGARRELEDLSAALGYWDDEHHFTKRPKVVLPEKPGSPRDALTRNQAASLLKASMGWRGDPKRPGKWKRLQGSSIANRAHLRRFILIGLYTGTRPGCGATIWIGKAVNQDWKEQSKQNDD